MTFVASFRMEWLLQRCHKDAFSQSLLRTFLLILCLTLVLSVSLYPGLKSIGVQLHSALTGSYVPGHHSALLINSPNEQTAKDVGRAIMEKRLAASINILSRSSTMLLRNHKVNEALMKAFIGGQSLDIEWRFYWKGEIQDASEILLLVRTKTSKIQQVVEFVRSIHPYANPEVISFPVQDGSLAHMKWMDEAIPDD